MIIIVQIIAITTTFRITCDVAVAFACDSTLANPKIFFSIVVVNAMVLLALLL